MKFMFRDDKKTPHGIQSRLIIETNQALVGMTIANDGKPLSPEERDAEISRLKRFVDDPAELEKKQRKERKMRSTLPASCKPCRMLSSMNTEKAPSELKEWEGPEPLWCG